MAIVRPRNAKWQASGYFVVSSVFHYAGPSFAVLLFSHVAPLGVAWLRIVSAAIVFAVWRRPWRAWRAAPAARRWLFVALGVVLGVMNSLFYLAIDRLDLAEVGTIEFLGVITVAAVGVRTPRNLLALAVTVGGVAVLSELSVRTEPLGLALAFGNATCFAIYLVLGHRIATTSGSNDTPRDRWSGVDQLGLSMIIAAVVASVFGLSPATVAVTHPLWLAWGVGVGVCSSVIPYVTDQLAMAKLQRAAFALMMALLPVFATVIGAVVLHQVPTVLDLCGIGLVVAGIVVHRDRQEAPDG